MQGTPSDHVLVLLNVLAFYPALVDQRIDDERRLGQGQGVNILELAKIQHARGLLIASGHRLAARGLLIIRAASAVALVGHSSSSCVCKCAEIRVGASS